MKRRKALGINEERIGQAFGGRLEFRYAPLTDEKAQQLIQKAATKPKKEILEYHFLRLKFIFNKVSLK